MRPFYAALALASLVAMAVLAIALLGDRIAPVPAALIGTTLFVALMGFSGKVGTD